MTGRRVRSPSSRGRLAGYERGHAGPHGNGALRGPRRRTGGHGRATKTDQLHSSTASPRSTRRGSAASPSASPGASRSRSPSSPRDCPSPGPRNDSTRSGSASAGSRRKAARPRHLSPRKLHHPVGRFPSAGSPGAGSPTSSVVSADSDFSPPVARHFVSFAQRYHRSALFAPPESDDSLRAWTSSIAAPAPPHHGGKDEISQVPGRPLRTCPALRPRRTPGPKPLQDRRCSLPHFKQRRLRVCPFRGSITRPARSLCTLRSRGRPQTTQHSIPAGGQP